MSRLGITVGLGQRPSQTLVVVDRDGIRHDLGPQVAGDDLVARFYQWRQKRKINTYCRARLVTLTGTEREEFTQLMEVARRG